jgi:hypothetical protein
VHLVNPQFIPIIYIIVGGRHLSAPAVLHLNPTGENICIENKSRSLPGTMIDRHIRSCAGSKLEWTEIWPALSF